MTLTDDSRLSGTGRSNVSTPHAPSSVYGFRDLGETRSFFWCGSRRQHPRRENPPTTRIPGVLGDSVARAHSVWVV